ncbi:MAG TPA: TonB family protein [Pyrinomonadaceae bacterium]|nr:TonB family protein [Pyrinomonadaceae bacterium]
MRQILFNCLCVSLLLVALAAVVLAQLPSPAPNTPECSFPILKMKEVDKRVKILAKPEPQFPRSDREKFRSKSITLTAVFCGSGSVTDIRVTQGLNDAMDEEAIKAARRIQFIPAEKDGNKVSQKLNVVYLIQGGMRP